MAEGVAQLADEDRVAIFEQGGEVAQEHEAVALDGFHRLERGKRIGAGAHGAAAGVDEAGGEAPGMERTARASAAAFTSASARTSSAVQQKRPA